MYFKLPGGVYVSPQHGNVNLDVHKMKSKIIKALIYQLIIPLERKAVINSGNKWHVT